MYPFTHGFENQRESRLAKSQRAGELTGNSWIKLPKFEVGLFKLKDHIRSTREMEWVTLRFIKNHYPFGYFLNSFSKIISSSQIEGILVFFKGR